MRSLLKLLVGKLNEEIFPAKQTNRYPGPRTEVVRKTMGKGNSKLPKTMF